MRLNDTCVSSETIKHLTNAYEILYLNSLGHYPWLLDKRGREIGDIVPTGLVYLGDDVIIKEIRIRNNPVLSKELTDEYQGKALIMSIKDIWN